MEYLRSGGRVGSDYRRGTAVVLDGQPLWLDALGAVLAEVEIEVVAKTTSPAVALEALEGWNPTLFLLDFDLEEPISGVACVRKAQQLSPQLRIVALSDRRESERIDAALAAGAMAYVLKTAQAADILAVVGQAFDHSIFLRTLSTAPLSQAEPGPYDDTDAGLTERELEVLRLVSDGHSNAELARMLWVTEQTVKFHLSNIYRKINVANRTEASRWAQLHGVLGRDLRRASF